MSEKKITFAKGRPESTSNRQSNDFKEEKIRKEKEKYSIEKRVSKVMSEKGVSLSEAINIVRNAPQKSERPFNPKEPGFNSKRKPYLGAKKPFDGEKRPYNPDRKPRPDAEKREYRQKDGEERKSYDGTKKPFDGERKAHKPKRRSGEDSEGRGYKPRKDMKFGERRNSGGDNSLLLALQKKIEILKNAGKLKDGSE